jgi:putative chitinase
MIQLTAQTLAEACHVKPADAAPWVEPLNAAMARYEIDTPSRAAIFLPEIAHESGRFRWVKELWGPTEAQKRYEGRKDLGNIRAGDGRRYMGRGLIQITGRANYRAVGVALGIDAEGRPELLEQPRYAALSAAWFWHSRGLNALADAGRFDEITRRINGGQNGREDRRALWASAKQALGVA